MTAPSSSPTPGATSAPATPDAPPVVGTDADKKRELGRLIRFGAVGIVNTVITLASFALLTTLGLAGPPSSAIAFLIGALNSYFVNSRWTFSDLDSAEAAGVRFFAIQCLGAGLSAGGVAILEAIGASHFVAECAVVPCVTISLYGLARTFVFRSDPA